MTFAPDKKKCPKCGELDATDFSTCRYCGSPYKFKRIDDSADWGTFLKGPGLIVLALVVVGSLIMHEQLGQFFQWFGHNVFPDSKKDFNEANAVLVKDPTNYDALIKRGVAEAALFQNDKAVADFSQAIQLKPTADLYRQRAACFQAMSHEQEAEQDRKTADTLH